MDCALVAPGDCVPVLHVAVAVEMPDRILMKDVSFQSMIHVAVKGLRTKKLYA